MTARVVIVPGAMPSRDANGRALPAKLRFYAPGTTTPKAVYTDDSLTTAHSFPVLSDSAGRWPAIWADNGQTFDVAWSDQANDTAVATFSGLTPADDAVLASTDIANAAAEAAQAAANDAEASALRAEAAGTGMDTVATSATSLTVGTGSKSLTLSQSGKDFAVGMQVAVTNTQAAANRMVGIITAFADPAMTVNVSAVTGSGTATTWTIAQVPAGGVNSVAGLSGDVDGNALKLAVSLDNVNNTPVIGAQEIWVPAGAMIPRTTNGAATGLIELTTNKVMLNTLDFDASTVEYAQFTIAMPKSWDLGTVSFQPVWTHGSTTTNFKVSWGLQGVAISDADALDAAFGTAQYSNDVGGTTNALYVGPESSAITIGGTPAARDAVVFQVLRKADDATNDTLAVDGKLLGVRLIIHNIAGTDN